MKKIYTIVFILYLTYSILWAVYFDHLLKFKVFGINPFFLLNIIIGFIVFLNLYKFKKIKFNYDAKKIFLIIFIYVIYQLVVIYPLTLIEYEGLTLDYIKITQKYFLSVYFHRQLLLLIPFCYLFLTRFNEIRELDKFLGYIASISIIIFGLGVLNILSGNFAYTNTGEPRYLQGTLNVYFAFSFFYGVNTSKNKKNNYILIIISLIGFIFCNHRSGYVTLFALLFILIIYNFFSSSIIQKISYLKILIFTLLAIFIIFSISEKFSNMFFARLSSLLFFSIDYNYLDRVDKNYLAFITFLDNPINGTLHSGIYYPLGVFDEYLKTWQPHNFVFDILASQGIIGISFIGILIYYILKVAIKTSKIQKDTYELFTILFYLIYALANVTFLNGTTIIIFALMVATIIRKMELLKIKKSDERNINI